MSILHKLADFFGKVDGSRKGLIVPEELFRSIITSLGSGATIGLLITVLQAVLSHATTIFPDPSVAGLASVVLTLILDLLRRQNQGTPPASRGVEPPTTI